MIDDKELAKRAVQSKSWRWMRGMSVISDIDVDAIVWHGEQTLYVDQDDVPHFGCIKETDLPDLSDQTTLSCLLTLVRAYWGDYGAHTRRFCRYAGGEKWMCCAPSVAYPTLQTDGTTEAECLVKALEMEVGGDND